MREREKHSVRQSARLRCRGPPGAECGGDRGCALPGKEMGATEAPGTVSSLLKAAEPSSVDECLSWFQLVWGDLGWRPGPEASEAGCFTVVSGQTLNSA